MNVPIFWLSSIPGIIGTILLVGSLGIKGSLPWISFGAFLILDILGLPSLGSWFHYLG